MISSTRTKKTKDDVGTSTRLSSRLGAMSLSGSPSLDRPPIVLDWGETVLTVGYCEQYLPQFVLPYDTYSPRMPERQSYVRVLELVKKLWSHLFMAERRVVCVCFLSMSKSWKSAVQDALFTVGVPEIGFVTNLDVVPYAMGWTRGIIVDIGSEETQIIAHVDGRALYDTYQAVKCGYDVFVDSTSDKENESGRNIPRSNPVMSPHWLEKNNPQSVVYALLTSLEACPRDIRKSVASNIVLVGSALQRIPEIRERLGQSLNLLFQDIVSTEEELLSLKEEKKSADGINMIFHNRWKSLLPLSSVMALTSTEPCRPDIIYWFGANVWSTAWIRQKERTSISNIAWISNDREGF